MREPEEVDALNLFILRLPGCMRQDLLRLGLAEVRPLPSPSLRAATPLFSRPSPCGNLLCARRCT